MSLSPNAIPTLHNTLNLPNYQPVVQILDIKLLNSKRYQLVISDGKFYQQALLSPNCNDVIGLEGIGIFHMIKILEYVCNLVKETKILFITELEALSAYDCQIGNPSRYNDIKNSQENPTQEQTPHKLIPEKLIPKSTDLLYVPIRALNPNSSN